MKKLTAKEVYKKYKGKYIDFYRTWDYSKDCYFYEVRKFFSSIHENTELCSSENFDSN